MTSKISVVQKQHFTTKSVVRKQHFSSKVLCINDKITIFAPKSQKFADTGKRNS